MSNTFGSVFKITSFGESHGPAIGVVLDGCPAGIIIDESKIKFELDRRKPGQSALTTARKEDEAFEILSGVFEGKSTGSPITIVIRNKDSRSEDYSHIADKFRPSHADFTYHEKYGHRDYRGGGRSSARITAGWVAAGAIAKQVIAQLGVESKAYVSQVGDIQVNKQFTAQELNPENENEVRCPDAAISKIMTDRILEVKKEGDTIGGVVTGIISGVPAGLGEPVFGKLQAHLAMAMMNINAAKGFDYGSGFSGVEMKGSEHNDIFEAVEDQIITKSNFSGGIQGGISNGQDIYYRVAFKPVATIMKEQESVDEAGKSVTVKGKGRHDPCVVPRAVPIVEAMAALVIADFVLMNQSTKLVS
ncbi:MAG: chorismate synthase [Bacteroidota bacterium]